jgi:flagellar assembly protein FliH
MAAILKSSSLKSESSSTGSDYPQLVAFNVEDVQSRARDYLNQVQKEAAEILAAARKEADVIRERSRTEGIAAAQSQVQQQIQEAAQQLSDQRCKTAISACEATVSQLTQNTAEWLSLWRNQTVELAAKIAEKLVRREMEDGDETLRVWMEEAIVALRDARDVRVLVHPDDFAVAGRFLQQLAKSVPQAATVEVLPDPEISAGGCIVRSTHGQIDQQLETQLQRLVDQLS